MSDEGRALERKRLPPLSAETRRILKAVKPLAPFFSNAIEAEHFAEKYQRGPFKVLPYAGEDGRYVVFDTRAALGRGVVGKPLADKKIALAALLEAWAAAGKPPK